MNLRILHTADWHIGKKLYDQELLPFQQKFFNWLIETIKSEKTDVLLVSGDVFDQANPTHEARKLYYWVLAQLSRLNCQVIITGGNHDSPGMLNATGEILKYLNITVIGTYPDNVSDLLVPIGGNDQKPKAVVAAVPFLRDTFLRTFDMTESDADRLEKIRMGIKKIFDDVAAEAKSQFPDIPLIGMGHLYVQGATVSESEREIQVGNLAAFEVEQFHQDFRYVALGHIHKPQNVSKDNRVVYSGSPLPLSFDESQIPNRVMILELKTGAFDVVSKEIPRFVNLKTIRGSFDHIQEKINGIKSKKQETPLMLEVFMEEENFQTDLPVLLEQLVSDFSHENTEIIKYRYSFKNRVKGTDELFQDDVSIDELKPEDVLLKKMESENLDDEKKELLLEAFREILDEIRQGE